MIASNDIIKSPDNDILYKINQPKASSNNFSKRCSKRSEENSWSHESTNKLYRTVIKSFYKTNLLSKPASPNVPASIAYKS